MRRASVFPGLALLVSALTITNPAVGQPSDSAPPDAWAWRATVYGWFPNARATTSVGLPGGGNVSIDTKPDNYLTNLQFAFMGTLEARKGPWSFIGDAVYIDFGKLKSNLSTINTPAGNLPLPVSANASADLKAFVGELEVGYALTDAPAASVDLMVGARYLGLKSSLSLEFNGTPPGLPPQINAERSTDIWDGVVGLRGRSAIGTDWFVPYYVDVGTGSSRVTWQAFGGIGYHFRWGDAMIGYRYLAYDFPKDRPVSDLSLGGPILGVGFRF